MKTNEKKDFEKYSLSKGISSLKLHNYQKSIEASMTPMVLEERELRATLLSVFDRLMMDRILWVAGPINDTVSTVVQAQLMFLDSIGTSDITMHIDSPGGSVKSGLSIVDVMHYIKSDIATINTGMAASMGSILLGAGKKGKRSSLRFSKVMLHQSSGGFHGNIQDAEIDWKEWKQTNEILFDLLSEFCNKPAKVIKKDSSRDYWMTASQALEYGIIDEVISPKKS